MTHSTGAPADLDDGAGGARARRLRGDARRRDLAVPAGPGNLVRERGRRRSRGARGHARADGMVVREPFYRARRRECGQFTGRRGLGAAGKTRALAIRSPGWRGCWARTIRRIPRNPPRSVRWPVRRRRQRRAEIGARFPSGGPSAESATVPAGDDLRTEESVARIWIAPFVDANGIYREASHVWVVLEAARWRLP